jgi:hypothetical protein
LAGGGGGGAAGLILAPSASHTTSTNISGGNGGNGGGRSGYGGGGGGGGVGIYAQTGSVLTNSSSQVITGGNGGAGGGGASGVGAGGAGGAGIYGHGFSLVNSGAITGGAGGAGGAGLWSGDSNPQYGGGGNLGGAGVSGSSFSITNNGSITGGRSGDGGASAPGSPYPGQSGGSAYGGGAGVSGTGFSLTNNGFITGGQGGNGGVGAGGTGYAGYGGAGVVVLGSGATVITNSGTIVGGAGGSGSLGTLGGYFAKAGNGGAGISVQATGGTTTVNNAVGATISGGAAGSGVGGVGIDVASSAILTTLTNLGSIIGGGGSAVGISNAGSITTLTNAQGQGNSNGALTYTGNLPTNYNIIVNGPASFGKLAASSVTGVMTFGVYGASTLAVGKYLSVLTGINASNLTGAYTNQIFGVYKWSLVATDVTTWELDVATITPPGPSTANTQQSLVNTAQVLQGTYTLQNSVLANSFTYDCTEFGANNVCVSAGGRNTAVSAANGLNNTSALLIAAYRPHPNYRIGAYADQNLSVNNAGSTVNLGNNTPLIGLFGAWSERLDGTGTEVKVSAAYGQKNTTITRSVVGSGATASEAGSGSSQLNSQGAQVTAKYGFGVVENVIVAPYVGIRYTQNNIGGYTEGASATITAPLTYSALNTNATTVLAGIGASYRFIPQATAFASAGVETDTNTANGTYSATGLSGLTPINFNANPVKTRPTAMLGATYDVEKNQRVGLTGIYRQEAYQATATTTVMATYTVGF